MKKSTIILFVLLSILINSTLNATATNLDSISTEQITNFSKASLYSTTGKKLPENVMSFFENNGAEINDDTVVEVLPVNGTTDTAVCITNVENNIETKDIFLAYEKNDDNEFVIDNTLANDYIIVESEAGANFERYSSDFVVHATAKRVVHTNYISYFYKPYGCDFYYDNNSGVNVTSITVDYVSRGVLYTYPGYEYTGENYNHQVHNVRIWPIAGVTYSTTNYFYTDRVLSTDGGDVFVGQYLVFYVTLENDSTNREASIPI